MLAAEVVPTLVPLVVFDAFVATGSVSLVEPGSQPLLQHKHRRSAVKRNAGKASSETGEVASNTQRSMANVARGLNRFQRWARLPQMRSVCFRASTLRWPRTRHPPYARSQPRWDARRHRVLPSENPYTDRRR